LGPANVENNDECCLPHYHIALIISFSQSSPFYSLLICFCTV
jgi:hypothetical protein